jgi:hypothetical protein
MQSSCNEKLKWAFIASAVAANTANSHPYSPAPSFPRRAHRRQAQRRAAPRHHRPRGQGQARRHGRRCARHLARRDARAGREPVRDLDQARQGGEHLDRLANRAARLARNAAAAFEMSA